MLLKPSFSPLLPPATCLGASTRTSAENTRRNEVLLGTAAFLRKCTRERGETRFQTRPLLRKIHTQITQGRRRGIFPGKEQSLPGVYALVVATRVITTGPSGRRNQTWKACNSSPGNPTYKHLRGQRDVRKERIAYVCSRTRFGKTETTRKWDLLK